MRAIRSGELADRAFARLADALEIRDRAWVHELVYGTLRLRGRLDFVLARFVKKGIASLDDDVLKLTSRPNRITMWHSSHSGDRIHRGSSSAGSSALARRSRRVSSMRTI